MALREKVAIVTGGGTGLGAAVSLGLAERGARVLVNYAKSAEAAEQTAAACRARGVDAVAIRGDVSSDADCRALVEAAVARWGRVDVLVNNAGRTTFTPAGDLEALADEDFLDIYRTNLLGAYHMIRACAPPMRKAGFGAVVNVSSIAGLTGVGSSVAYACSKGALNTLTLSLARALGPQIRVNAVCPGFIATRWFSDPLGEAGMQRIIEAQQAQTPLQRAGAPEDIAKSVLFLADEGSEHITGVTLLSDAGFHLGPTPSF
jgi:3-oxoacyl-[acyl-carrier protein] reductase